MEKYSIIRPSRDEKIIGMNYSSVHPHPDCFREGVNILHRFKINKFIELDQELKFTLSRGANLCDVMKESTISAAGLLISERFAKFLMPYNLGIGLHKFYNAHIYSLAAMQNYYWLQFIWDKSKDIVDYKNTTFFVINNRNEKNILNISNNEEYCGEKEKIGKNRSILFEKIKFTNPPIFDIFLLPLRGYIIVGERLKTDIQNAGFTGIEFLESPIEP
ncbi:MAG TPA: hypothetical protein PLL53_18925 [Saprospiraceae bacterium]|nr:hypothetical protein [Saprospiraceae bacterium]